MGETADRIVADIADARDTMDRDLRALKTRVRTETDLRRQARRHPWFVAGIAVGVVAGIALAGVLFAKALRG